MPEQRQDTPDHLLHLNIANRVAYRFWLRAARLYIREPSEENLSLMLLCYNDVYSDEAPRLSDRDRTELERYSALVSDIALVEKWED